LLSLVLEVVVFALNLPLIGIFAFVVHAKTIHKQNWYYHHKRSTEMSQTINEVIEVPAPPKERAPVVHVEQEETAKECFRYWCGYCTYGLGGLFSTFHNSGCVRC
jgi:hypothetical protein